MDKSCTINKVICVCMCVYVWGEGGGGAEFLCITVGEIWNVYVQKFAFIWFLLNFGLSRVCTYYSI